MRKTIDTPALFISSLCVLSEAYHLFIVIGQFVFIIKKEIKNAFECIAELNISTRDFYEHARNA